MPVNDEIPERYPVIEHMERRLEAERQRERGPSLVVSLAVGLVGGGLILAAMVIASSVV